MTQINSKISGNPIYPKFLSSFIKIFKKILNVIKLMHTLG